MITYSMLRAGSSSQAFDAGANYRAGLLLVASDNVTAYLTCQGRWLLRLSPGLPGLYISDGNDARGFRIAPAQYLFLLRPEPVAGFEELTRTFYHPSRQIAGRRSVVVGRTYLYVPLCNTMVLVNTPVGEGRGVSNEYYRGFRCIVRPESLAQGDTSGWAQATDVDTVAILNEPRV